MMIELPPYVWRSVRTVLAYQRARLERKASRSSSDRSAQYDLERVDNLDIALSAIDAELGEENCIKITKEST
jgi:hypothetical protein